MPKQDNPWAAMDEGIAAAAGVQQRLQASSSDLINLDKQGYKNLYFSHAGKYDQQHHGTFGNQGTVDLLAQLDKSNLGFQPQISAGYANIGHSNGKGGEHIDPGVFDIGLAGRTQRQAQQLKSFFESRGIDVLEEDRGTANWHLHVRGGSQKAQPRTQSAAKPAAAAAPVAVAPNKPVDLLLPLTQDIHGNILTRKSTQGVTGAEIEQFVQSNIPQQVKLDAPPPTPVDKDNPWAAMDAAILEAGKPKPAPAAPVTQPNGFDQFGAGFQNALTGFTNDELARRAGGFWGGAGNILGTLGFVGGSGLAGAGLGSVVPGAGTAGGGVAGLVAGGTAAGGLQEAQRERLAGEQMNLLKIGGASAIGGLTSLPVGGAASTLGRTILKNAAIDAGINTAGDVGLQMVEQGTIDPRRLDLGRAAQAAAIGAGTGGLGGLTHAKSSQKASSTKPVASAFQDAAEAEKSYQQALKKETDFNSKIERQYKSGAAFDARYAELEGKVRDRSITPKEYKEYQRIKTQVDQQTQLITATDAAKDQMTQANTPQSRSALMQQLGLEKRPYQLTPEEAARLDVTPKVDMLNKPEAVKELNQGFQQRVYDATGQPRIIDPRNSAIPEEFGPLKTETTDSGLQIVTKANGKNNPRIDIVRDPFYRAEPAAPVAPAPDLSKPVDTTRTPLSQVIDEGLSGDNVDRDSLLAFDTLETLGYDVHDITKKNNTSSVGKQYSVKIGGKTVRFEDGQTLGGLMSDHQISSSTVAKGVNMRGGKFNQERLLEMLPDSPAKQRFLSEQGAADIASREAAEAAHFAKAEADANELMARIDQAENMDHLSELFQEAMDPKYQDSPASETIFNALESAERRLAGDPNAPVRSTRDIGLRRADEITGQSSTDMLGGKPAKSNVVQMPARGRVDLLDAQGRPLRGEKPAPVDLLKPKQGNPAELEIPRPFTRPETPTTPAAQTRDMLAPVEKPVAKPVAEEPGSGIYRTPEGGEVYTHGRDMAAIQQQLQGVQGQIANIAEIERHLQTHNPEAVPAIRNILNAGKNSEAAKFSYIAREAPGEAPRVRDNFVPTHFTFESIKPATQRDYLRRVHGSDEEVIAHLKQEILNRGGSIDASSLQTKGGADVDKAIQISRLIKALDTEMGGAYLKSPRVHGINLGETTRSAAGGRGIRLDTIVDSSLTGRKVTPEMLAGHAYDNKISATFKALDQLAQKSSSPVFSRAIKQIQKGGASRNTMRELKKALADKELGVQFCNIFGVAHD